VTRRLSLFVLVMLGIGYAFLYGPIVSLIIFSFNESKLVTVWGGFSVKWYGELAKDDQVLSAAALSLEIAALSATFGIILGTIAGYVLARLGPFRGRTLFTGMVTSPLVMPEVITGLSLLLLFVALEQAIGWPAGRGLTTIVIAHTTFTMAYATVVMQSRLSSLDRSLDEAAQDLGARPLKVFFVITLPIVFPAILSGWLLSFTLSLDDLVTSSFVTGPGRHDPADGDLLQGAARPQSGDQRARHHHHRDRRDRGGGGQPDDGRPGAPPAARRPARVGQCRCGEAGERLAVAL
jgi:putrescine transport system permease protein